MACRRMARWWLALQPGGTTTARPQQHQHLCIVAESKLVVAAVGIFEDAAALVWRPVVVLAEGVKEGVDMSLVDAFGFALGFLVSVTFLPWHHDAVQIHCVGVQAFYFCPD